jgi:carbon monoxide dehydrogenase subunit G
MPSNNLNSNVTRKVARVFLDAFENSRVITKTVDTQLLADKFNPSSGSTVDFKRPHDYNTIRTSGGDISSSTKSAIIAGKATGTVQNYFTAATEWGNVEEALQLDQLEDILAPMARRIVTDLELDFASFMLKNSSLRYGTHGTAVDAWSDVAGAGAFMDAIGINPASERYYLMNPFTVATLASAQSGLNSVDSLIRTAWENAQISTNFGGLRALSATTLASFTSSSGADRAGTLSSAPDATYVTAKDTMTQSLAVTAFQANMVVKAGELVTIANVNRLNQSTRQAMVSATGSTIAWTGVVTADVTLGSSGEGTLVVAGPAIYEANGQYNTVTAAPASGAVITIVSATATLYQPNLFYTKQAFGMGTVKLPKLYSTDTVATTSDGMSIRISKYSDGNANSQQIRFDLLPAYACFDPSKAGQGFGVA